MNNLLWWGLLCGFCIILEMGSPGYFFFFAFAGGAVGAALSSWLSYSVAVQLGAFLATSMLMFVVLSYYARWLAVKDTEKTNVYALKGKKGVVLARITPLSRGWVVLEGQTWSAVSIDNHTIDKGIPIQVVDTAGSHVIVKNLMKHL